MIALGSSPSEHVRKQELRREVQRAVENLSDSDREIILMRHFEDLSNQEVAQALGLEPSTATMRYGRALVRLQTALAENSAFAGSVPAVASNVHTGNCHLYLGECLTHLGRYEDAEAELFAAEKILAKALSQDHAWLKSARRALVRLYYAWAKEDNADRWPAMLELDAGRPGDDEIL